MEKDYFIEHTLQEGFSLYGKKYVVFLLGALLASIGSILIVTMPPLLFGLFLIAQKLIRNEDVRVMQLFEGFSYFGVSWRMFLSFSAVMFISFLFFTLPALFSLVAVFYEIPYFLIAFELIPKIFKEALLTIIATTIGFLFLGALLDFISPAGFLICVVFQYAAPYALSKKLGALKALEESFRVARGNMAYSILFMISLFLVWFLVAAGLVGVSLLAYFFAGFLSVLVTVTAICLWSIIFLPYAVICISIAAERLKDNKI